MLYDKKGIPVREFDVLKMYHFTGARRKKHYMYKWVRKIDEHLVAWHLTDGKNNSWFKLDQQLLNDCEIVQGYNCHGSEIDFVDRPRRTEKEAGGE